MINNYNSNVVDFLPVPVEFMEHIAKKVLTTFNLVILLYLYKQTRVAIYLIFKILLFKAGF